MKYALICETPYQLFNMLNFIYSELDDNDTIDLFINIINKGMSIFSNRLKNSSRFNEVYSYTSPQKKDGKIIYKYRRLLEYFFSVASLNYSLDSKINTFSDLYDVVVLAFPNPLIVNFCYIYSKADIWFIEDGTGSYHGKIGEALGSKLSKILEPIIHKGPSYIKPSRLYVYKPEICKSQYPNMEIRKLNTIDPTVQLYKHITDIFENPNNDNHTLLTYISQPINTAKYSGIEREIFKLVWNNIQNMCVRIHPTETTNDYVDYKGLLIDEGTIQWEVQCAKQINNKSILIGTCSTAQMTPKLVYDIEPYVIFTLNIYRDVLDHNLLDRWEILVNDLRSLYTNPDKVFLPKSVNELNAIIEDIKQKVNAYEE